MEQVAIPIDGSPFHTADSIDVLNPWDGTLVGRVPVCGEAEVDLACQGAKKARGRDGFPSCDRARVLERAADLVRDEAEDLAWSITRESGKPITGARTEVGRALDTLAFAAVEARKLVGEMVPLEASESGAGKLGFALRVPVGVVAAITPFNFPLNLVLHKLAPAIAAGCPVVLKPASETPLTAIRLVDLLVRAGLPDDWISIVTGGGSEVGGSLVSHPVPGLVSFTGSAAVGWSIAKAAPKKRVRLELGSNSPVIVEPDADLDRVTGGFVKAAFGNAGQSCISVQRVLVHEDVYDDVRDRLRELTGTVVAGDPANEDTVVGPVIRKKEIERLVEWLDEAVKAGARVLAGGKPDGRIFPATLVENVPRDCKLSCEEVFGPVAVLTRYGSFDEAVELANDSPLGIHVGVFTRDLGRALAAARRLRFGGVLVNEMPTWRADQQPYGGVRQSGNTREGPAYSVLEMTELRFVSLQP